MSSSLNSLSTLRMTGMASGMDTESIVTQLMNAEKMKYTKLERQKIKMDWKKAANLEVNNLLKVFKDKYFSAASPETNILSASKLVTSKVTMGSTTTSLAITANTDATEGTHTVNSITTLATGANTASSTSVNSADISLNTELASLQLNTALDFSGGDISFSINGEQFEFSTTDTLRTMLSEVNSNEDANVTMSYSNLTGKFSITSKNLGTDSELIIANGTGNAFGTGSAFGIAEETSKKNGTDASLMIDNVSVTKDTNNFTIDGVTYALKATASTAVSFEVERDIDGAVEKIKGFIDDYNKLIDTLDSKINEEVYSDYEPLTDDEKAELSDAQIEKLEDAAKSGLLKGDSNIARILRDLRGSFFDKVTGADTNASSIGLSTMGYLTKGAIQVDETKLREALAKDPDKVMQIITNKSTSTNATTKYNDSGLAARMSNTVNTYLNDYAGYRTESFNDQYERLEDRMDWMQDYLDQREDRYWSQFTRLETAMEKMNSQSTWLTQQLASMG